MGCGGSKSAVMPLEETSSPQTTSETALQNNSLANGNGQAKGATATRRPSAHHLQGDEPPEEQLNNLAPLRPINLPNNKIGQPLAFEVPIQDEDSLIRRHPPRRLQRLEDQQPEKLGLTHELIDEKQAEAEQRRMNIISQRVQSAKQRIPKKRLLDMDGLGQNEEMIETLKYENTSLEL